jgi:Putative manganese efflux pump
VTLVLATTGVLVGAHTGTLIGRRAEVLGGLVLIGIGILTEIDRAGRHRLAPEPLAQAAEAGGRGEELDRLVVGRHHRAVFGHRDLLRAEQHLGHARLERIRALAQDVAQRDLG